NDLGSNGGPRRLSTPRLAESEQIRLDGSVHAANGPASGEDTAPEGWLAANRAGRCVRGHAAADCFVMALARHDERMTREAGD
ncbi:hypothetical protein KV691_13980, partial [Xanthomonas euvesicatoria pv. alangii]|nr:hypothetical protein [Xanthomonas euvesicatoria pv. alangii]